MPRPAEKESRTPWTICVRRAPGASGVLIARNIMSVDAIGKAVMSPGTWWPPAAPPAWCAELERGGRLTGVELVQRVGLTTGPCLRRVQRLEAGPDRPQPRSAGRGDGRALRGDFGTGGEVRERRRPFGSPDYFVRVAVTDLAGYETFLSRRA
ncbi:winged helix-turn-helix transcriptional regulator [Streptomyces longisporus]|uniref:Uncharacterized protein n=1 Tax=Streptomyces longisporus TaxID=1948 RepID=A0ABN3L260_STRLO